jgi:hypothetical protein
LPPAAAIDYSPSCLGWGKRLGTRPRRRRGEALDRCRLLDAAGAALVGGTAPHARATRLLLRLDGYVLRGIFIGLAIGLLLLTKTQHIPFIYFRF